jgi:hypothetical protein
MSVFSRMENELQQINLSVEQKGPIDLEAFKSFTKFHQSILYLAFNVQMKLRRTILGDEFWEMLSRRRLKLSKGRYMSLTTILMIVSGHACCGCSEIVPVISLFNCLPVFLQQHADPEWTKRVVEEGEEYKEKLSRSRSSSQVTPSNRTK